MRWKLIAVFSSLLLVGSIVLMVVSGVFINFRLANELMHHSLTTVAMADEWNANLVRAQSGYQSYLLTGDPAYLEAYETYREEQNRLLDELIRSETRHDPGQAARWQQVVALLQQRRQNVTLPGIELRRQVDRGEATMADIDAFVSDAANQDELIAISDAIRAVKETETEFLAEQTERAENAQSWLQRTMVTGLILILATGVILTVVLLRDLIPPVSRLSRVARQIANGQLDRRIGIQRGDELGEMAESFDQMADQVYALVQEQQASLRSIREHEAVVQAVMDGVSVGIMMVDSDARVAIANQPVCDLLGLTSEELFNFTPEDLVGLVSQIFVDDQRVYDSIGGELFTSDETMTVVFEQDIPASRHLEVYTAPVFSAAGDRLGRIFALRDVTQEREVDRMKTEFVSMVSHELRTPLTSIKGYVDLIREGEVGPMSEEQAAFLEIVAHSTDRLVALINDLLDISRIESGKIELKREQIDLASLIQTVAAAFRPQLASKQQSLNLSLPPEPLPILADTDRIAQVLTNLLSNAHKYSPAGGTIELAANSVDDTAEVHVTDSGIGISPADQSQLFTRFYRASNKVVQEAGGTGLGLAITRSLVELHGGSIRVKSALGEGSTFTVSLPLIIADGRGNDASFSADDSGRRRLLVVEDEPAIAGLLQRYLQRAGYQVTIATTAGEGLRQARWLRPDLITLDVQLPDVDGFVLLEWLRKDPGTMDIPVVFISISPDEGHGQRLGAVDHLTKPVDEATLLNRVGQILSGDGKFVILVADDDAETRHLIVDLLRRAGHRTIEARDGAAAIAAAEKASQLDLALIDVRMPGTDGLEALRILRNQERTCALPVVMMTASAGVESSRSDIEALGATLVQKPLAARELVDAISTMLERREA